MAAKTIFIFCFECDEASQSDRLYISKLIDYFYGQRPDVRPVYLDGKSKYNAVRVISQIKKHQRIIKMQYSDVSIKTIYFIDRDAVVGKENHQNKTELDKIVSYCNANCYELVLFVKEIEDVIGISNRRDKVQASKDFILIAEQKLVSLDQNKLSKDSPNDVGESNILCILDHYFERIK